LEGRFESDVQIADEEGGNRGKRKAERSQAKKPRNARKGWIIENGEWNRARGLCSGGIQ
jgi:hypothetical protein